VIGIPGRIKGISGGEMKRLSFASEVGINILYILYVFIIYIFTLSINNIFPIFLILQMFPQTF